MYAKFHHNFLHSSRDRAIFTFFRIWSSAKPRTIKNVSSQSRGLDRVYANVYQNIPLISMFTQKFIKIFHSVQQIGPFSLFQNLALGKASTDDKCHFAIPWARTFHIKLSAKFYQNIPNGLRVKFHFFQNLNLGKTSTNPKCHLTISWATSCQYQCVCKISSQYSALFKR